MLTVNQFQVGELQDHPGLRCHAAGSIWRTELRTSLKKKSTHLKKTTAGCVIVSLTVTIVTIRATTAGHVVCQLASR